MMARILLASLIILITSDYADAWPRRYRSQIRTTTISRTSYSFSGSPAEVAQQKANLSASRNRMAHWGGSFAGCTYEGVGCSTTVQGALNNCCYTGQKPLAASAVAQGANGMFYAVKLFYSGSSKTTYRRTYRRGLFRRWRRR